MAVTPVNKLCGLVKTIFQNRNLTLLWLGQMVSQSGDSIYQIGLLWLALELSGSEAVTGLTAMASYLPALIFSLFAGVTADRLDRRRIMLFADGLRVAAILAIPAAWVMGILSPTFLGFNAFVIATGMAFFNPARDSMIPQIVPAQGLLRANSLVHTSWQMSMLLGPAVAGLLLHYVGNVHLFSADALAYAASFIFVYMIRFRMNAAEQIFDQTKSYIRSSAFKEVIEGLSFAVRHPVLLPLLLLTIADNIFIMGPALVGTPVFVKKELGLGAESYALVQAGYAVGMLIGTVALLAMGNRVGKGKLLLMAMTIDGFTFIPMYFVNTLAATELTIIIHSMAIPMLMVSRSALIQGLVKARMTGRIFALVNMAVVGMSAMSSGATGFLLEAWGARTVFLVIGIGGGMCGIVGWALAKQLRIEK